MIWTPKRSVFTTLDDLRKRKQIKPEDVAIDLHATIEISKKGKSEGRETFRCNSFTNEFMKFLRATMAHDDIELNSAYDDQTYTLESQSQLNWSAMADSVYDYWRGCLIGTGTTSATANDTRMEQQITHGTEAPNASAETGTTHASFSTTTTVYDDGNNTFTTDQYNYYILEITSGALSGEERIIRDTVDSPPDYLLLASTLDYYAAFASEPDNVTYKIKTYGMMTHGSNALTAPADDGDVTSTMTITRTFANGTGDSMDVTEFGCAFRFYDNTSYHKYMLGIHDVRSAVAIPNGQELTLTYTFSCEA